MATRSSTTQGPPASDWDIYINSGNIDSLDELFIGLISQKINAKRISHGALLTWCHSSNDQLYEDQKKVLYLFLLILLNTNSWKPQVKINYSQWLCACLIQILCL